jgi:hypothetical protein
MSSALLHQAIRERKQVTARYGGQPREFCPHALGYKDNEERVLVYQFGGSSSTGSLPQWKCFIVSRLTAVSLRDGPWHTDPHGHSQTQTCMDTVTVRA